MLDANVTLALRGTSYHLHVALERALAITTIHRHGLVWDTRILPRWGLGFGTRYLVLLAGRLVVRVGARRSSRGRARL